MKRNHPRERGRKEQPHQPETQEEHKACKEPPEKGGEKRQLQKQYEKSLTDYYWSHA